ncbi:MAG: PilZ domain-containing protein [Lachnospiraceae bacterium]
MEERRKAKRTRLQSKIVVKRLDGDEKEEVDIEVVDISKSGVGFTCNRALTIGAVYESYLTIWTKEVLHAILEIVRIEKKDDTISYGAIFVGMPEIDAARISVYQAVEENS